MRRDFFSIGGAARGRGRAIGWVARDWLGGARLAENG